MKKRKRAELRVLFYMMPERTGDKFVDKLFIRIGTGGIPPIIERPATSWDKKRFRKEWDQWRKNH